MGSTARKYDQCEYTYIHIIWRAERRCYKGYFVPWFIHAFRHLLWQKGVHESFAGRPWAAQCWQDWVSFTWEPIILTRPPCLGQLAAVVMNKLLCPPRAGGDSGNPRDRDPRQVYGEGGGGGFLAIRQSHASDMSPRRPMLGLLS